MKRPKYFYGYNIVASSFFIQALGIGTMMTFGVFFKPILSEFGWSRASLSSAQSVMAIVAGFFSIIIGRLNDKFGPRILIMLSGCAGLGLILMSELDSIWQLYLFYSVFVGIGVSAVDIIPLSTLMRWFIRRRGIMTGITKMGTGLGQFAIPLLANMFILEYDWRSSYLIIGISVLILLIISGLPLRREPESMGLLPDGDEESQSMDPVDSESGLNLQKALRTRQFWTLCLAYLTTMFCLFSVTVHIVPHATDIGLSSTAATGILSAIGATSIFGRFLTGIVIDRIGNKRTMVLCYILLIATFLWLQVATELWMFVLFAVVYAFAHGGLYTTISPVVAEYFGLAAHGSIFGIVFFFSTLGGAIGPVVAGQIFDITGSYSSAFWACTAAATAALALVLSLRRIKT
ncbi:MFS transporter [Chloroflexota bacterium]